MRMFLPVLFAALFGPAQASKEIVLENEWVRVTLDPEAGGAVTALTYKKATTFPLIADKGAGSAGSGSLFTPQWNGVALSALPMKSTRREEAEETIVVLAGWPKDGLLLERSFRMGKQESGFRLEDTWKSSRETAGSLGATSLQKAEPWRRVARSWHGDADRVVQKDLPVSGAETRDLETKAGRFFWRSVGPYGVGFLAQVQAPRGSAVLTHETFRENGAAVGWRWRTAETALEAGTPVSIRTDVLIDEGGREFAASGSRSGLCVDLRSAGRTGEAMPSFVTAVSARPFKGKIVLRISDREEKQALDVELEPGRGKSVPFEIVPARKGTLTVEAVLVDGAGFALATGSTNAIIDGEKEPAWTAWSRTIPSATYRGTWAEIGAQLAKAGRVKPRAADAKAAERLAFYARKFPLYEQMIRGAAEALKVKPEDLARSEGEAPAEACMNVLFDGPDGPISAFSKERSGAGLGGLAYMKVLPDKGYAYHVYECGTWTNGYGVNSEGLSTSGASINCDAGTTAAGRRETQAWRAAGRLTAPLGSHMMLAGCRTVEEAVAFIEDREAPFEFEGNMLIVDRAGNAARLESVGIKRQIQRYDGKKDRYFVAGNYPHESGDGLFKIGPDWGWAANTMRRERRLEEQGGVRLGRHSLADAVTLMETHGPGGMCQHIHDNIGGLYTSTSFLAVTRTGELWLSHGPPCRTRYVRFMIRGE